MTYRGIVLMLAAAALASCAKTQEDQGTSAKTESAAAAATEASTFRENPDFGGVRAVETQAAGIGGTVEEATLRALDAAISQVNGRRVASGQVASRSGIQVDVNGLRALDAQSQAFSDLVVSSSRGAVRSFSVVSSERVTEVEYEASIRAAATSNGWFEDSSFEGEASERKYDRYWKVTVRAEVAKFVGPKDDGRPALVVASPRVQDGRYAVGDNSIAASEVAGAIRQRLSDAIGATGRFKLLDREATAELQAEAEFIQSADARTEDIAKLGQRMSADLVLVPVIERFGYPRSTRQLRMSDRQLVSYAGGGRLTLRLINAATGEIVLSESFEHQLPATPPSTMPRAIDGIAKANELVDSLSGQMVSAIITKIFPISVVAMQGDTAVLSQGGDAVSVGQRYQLVKLGDEIKDPQTGRSLGRMDSPCCTIVIERVADKMAYARLEGGAPDLGGPFKPGMLEVRDRLGAASSSAVASDSSSSPASSAPKAATAARRTQGNAPSSAKPAAPSAAKSDEDENW